MFANFNRFSALTESSFRVSSLTANGNRNGDGYLDGKEGASISFKAPCISAMSIDRPLLPKLKKIVYTHARFSYPLSSATVYNSREIRKASIRNSHFQPLFLPNLPPRTRINIRHSISSPTTKGTSSSSPVNLTSLRRANKR